MVTPSSVSQHGQLSLPSLRGRLMSSRPNPCCSGLRRQTAEGVVIGVAYRPRQRVLLAARLECRLAAGSRPRNGDERRTLALWAVRESTSHWGLCLVFVFTSNDQNGHKKSFTSSQRPIFFQKYHYTKHYLTQPLTNSDLCCMLLGLHFNKHVKSLLDLCCLIK